MSRRSRHFLVALTALLISLGGVELGFRVLAPRLGIKLAALRQAQGVLLGKHAEFEAHPYTSYRHRRRTERLERVGRTEDRRFTRHAEGRRVLCLGGSTTESGNHLGQIGSYPFYLDKLLNLRYLQPSEVLQGGVAGWTTAESLVAWLVDYSDFQPDLVLIHHGINDVAPMFAPGFRSDYSHWRKPVNMPRPGVLERAVLRVSLLCTHLREKRGDLDLMVNSLRDEQPPRESAIEPTDVYKRNLRTLGRDASQRGAAVALLTMPAHPDASVMNALKLTRLQANNELMREVAREEDWILIDLERLFEERFPREKLVENFLDLVHVTPFGNLGKAEIIAEQLALQWPALEAL